ncbi:MAG: hypothetical protein NC078_07210 [Ruminococcus sp.]|nr:hypothetical protein [Ruminococcus sp.]
MSVRDLAICVIKSLPEEKVKAFLTLFADENTLVRAECDLMLENPDKCRRYNSVEELMEEFYKDGGYTPEFVNAAP